MNVWSNYNSVKPSQKYTKIVNSHVTNATVKHQRVSGLIP